MATTTKKQAEALAAVVNAGEMGFDNYDATARRFIYSAQTMGALIAAGEVEIFQNSRAPGRATRYRRTALVVA